MTVGILAGLALALALPSTLAAQPVRRPGLTCTASMTRTTWTTFIRAFTQGDYRRLDALFAEEPDFGWFSSNVPGLRAGTAAASRRTLVTYFRARHARGDALRLLTFAYHGTGDFTYTLQRAAGDYRRGARFRLAGKGAVDCIDGRARLIVVSLGGPGSAP
jgi:hypothetical protein